MPMKDVPSLLAGEATIEEIFFDVNGACYARILYRMDPPSEVLKAWHALREEALGLKADMMLAGASSGEAAPTDERQGTQQ
jgi:hypothetical protein